MASKDELLASSRHGNEALCVVKESEPVAWLAPSSELVHNSKIASEFLFALNTAYSVKCPLRKLHTDKFDAEQIWQQIDLQATPLLASLRRRLRRFEQSTGSIVLYENCESQDPQVSDYDAIGDTIEDNNGSEGVVLQESEADEYLETCSDEEDLGLSENDDGSVGKKHNVEDRFLRLSEMESFLDEAEATQGVATSTLQDTLEQNLLESEDEDMQMDGMLTDRKTDVESDDDDIKYGDFFGAHGKKGSRQMSKDIADKVTNTNLGDDQEYLPRQIQPLSAQENMTTHEKKLTKIQRRIDQLEKANLDSKLWTMQGEVSAMKRPKNSALEVELDFEHNVLPAPVITEEVTASLEDIIRKRIAEGTFDDVQRKPSLLSSAPKEQIELDENKSQKGLGELYEDNYMQKAGLAPVSVSPADELRKEAASLFKVLCVRLDALSHFHFTPKPVIEDMAVQLDVPAVAMEEVAPMAVSDAQMLAPEEVFKGEGALKAEAELTGAERKRRRAKKKQKLRVENKRKEFDGKLAMHDNKSGRKPQQSHYAKSRKVFEHLDQSKGIKRKQPDKVKESHLLPSLKL